MPKTLIQLDQQRVVQAIMNEQEKLPARIDGLCGELTELIDTFRLQIIGTYQTAVSKHRQKDNRYFQSQITKRAKAIRRDKDFVRVLKLTTDTLKNALCRKISTMQTRVYREGLKQICRVWNANTPAGLHFTSNVTKTELSELHTTPVGGLTVEEWVNTQVTQLHTALLRIATSAVVGEQEGGGRKRDIDRLIKRAFDRFNKEILSVACHALNIAAQAAFDQESDLFAEDKKWLYK